MPVRRIPKNYLFVTGRHASPHADEVFEFESILEKEYMLMLDSDPHLESYDVQPVEIPLSRGRSYVPDLLVTYSGVPMQCLRDIFAKLKHAEVILTFYIDALIKYLNERNLAAFQKATGVSTSVRASELDEIKQSPRWRVHLQSSLYQNLTNQCSAQFYTPFFIRPERGHGDFWLLHLSQHWKARDVMASTHWQHNNHFSHYGDAGFHMFSTGYISKIDDEHKLQAGFDFGEVAAAVSKETMLEQIPEMLFDGAEGMTFEQFFLKLINTTPATREMVEATLLELHQGGEIVVVDESGDPSRARVNLKGNHVLRLPSQRSFLFS
ncbi:three-Cys-motif partner protein TcmP [Ralstonia wenshanensis]|uniref:three-Cys-motif partner protein TcmP n=1 Tax=Ralstonia wenshanensis TaxID=2842456 RepID=UPI0039C6BED7